MLFVSSFNILYTMILCWYRRSRWSYI